MNGVQSLWSWLLAQWHLTFEPVWQVVDSLSLWGGQSCPQPAFKPAWRRVETRRRPGLAAPQRNPPSYAHSVLRFAGPFQKLSAIGLSACGGSSTRLLIWLRLRCFVLLRPGIFAAHDNSKWGRPVACAGLSAPPISGLRLRCFVGQPILAAAAFPRGDGPAESRLRAGLPAPHLYPSRAAFFASGAPSVRAGLRGAIWPLPRRRIWSLTHTRNMGCRAFLKMSMIFSCWSSR